MFKYDEREREIERNVFQRNFELLEIKNLHRIKILIYRYHGLSAIKLHDLKIQCIYDYHICSFGIVSILSGCVCVQY